MSSCQFSPVSGSGRGTLYHIETSDLVTQIYRRYIREAGLLRKFPSYKIQYELGRFFQSRMHPFRLIQRGQTCIQVGCTEWMLDFGVSQPMVMAGLVGHAGEVIAVDPDDRNEITFNQYVKRHGVSHARFHKDALFDEIKEAEFTFYEDRTSSNCITEVADVSVWQSSHQGRPTYTKTITLNTLDGVCEAENIIPDFVNISINDAEFGVIRGMKRILDHRKTSVAWLIGGGRSWWADSLEFFLERNFDVTVGDAPYSRRGPSKNGKVAFLSREEEYQEYYAVATPSERRSAHKTEVPISVIEIKEGGPDFFVELLRSNNRQKQ